MALYPSDVPVAAEISRAARSIRWRDDPWVIAYHPVARTNPYQALLYGRAWDHGFAPVAVTLPTDVSAVVSATHMGVRGAVHLHWTSTVIGGSSSIDEAEARLENFLDQLRRLKDQQIRIIWTVHNRLPHHCEYPELEIELCRGLADLADVVHIMAPDTVSEVSELYPLSEGRLLRAPHPAYVGAYPSHYSRYLVRFEMGFEPGDFLVGMIGSIQPYKGVDELITAVSEGPLHPRLRTLVAGIPGQDPASAELVERLKRADAIISIPKKLDDQNLARVMTALDVMALPYRTSLNSGAALLALSFGVPVVAPRIGHFKTLADHGYALVYDPLDPTGLASALRAAPAWASAIDRDSIRRDMARVSGPVVSAQFFGDLRAMLTQGQRPRESVVVG